MTRTLQLKPERCAKLSVVIPFFQRETGLLTKAVTSIFEQNVPDGLTVVVVIVDDGSPSPATSEPLPLPPLGFEIRIIGRSNGGVGMARNTGLDAVDTDTDYVAFLDSDDIWRPDHVQSALAHLDNGADFYFDNNLIDEGREAFSYYPRFLSRHSCTKDVSNPSIGIFEPQEAVNILLEECVSHTSQVVYNFKRALSLRFDTSFKRAGEDHLFWLNLAARSRTIAYDMRVLGERGKGVSIYRDTLAWGSPHILDRYIDELLMRRRMLETLDLSTDQIAIVHAKRRDTFGAFTYLLIWSIRQNPSKATRAITRLSKADFRSWALLPKALLSFPSYRAGLLRAS